MARVALIIFAGTETAADRGRLYNGLEAAVEFSNRVNDEVKLIFDGAGTRWIPELEDPDHEFHSLYRQVADVAACDGCVRTFGVSDAVADSRVTTLRTGQEHESVLSLVHEDYDVITF